MKTIALLFTIAILFSCKKVSKPTYPDCFTGLQDQAFLANISCDNVFMAVNLDKNRLVSISLSEQALDLQTTCKTYKVEDHLSEVRINYYTYLNHPDSAYFDYCTDMKFHPSLYGTRTTWKAVSGEVTAVVSKMRQSRTTCEGYFASVKLDGVRFVKENSTQDTIIQTLALKDRPVGYCYP